MLKNTKDNNDTNPKSTAKIVEGTLILSLPDAVSPVVWRYDLNQAKTSAVEIQDINDEKNTLFDLRFKTDDENVQSIAQYSEKSRAVNALMAIGQAMENAYVTVPSGVQQHQNPVASSHPQTGYHNPAPQTVAMPFYNQSQFAPQAPNKDGFKLWTAIGVVAVILVLFFWLGSMAPRTNSSAGKGSGGTAITDRGAEDQNGVPMSAEEFLSR